MLEEQNGGSPPPPATAPSGSSSSSSNGDGGSGRGGGGSSGGVRAHHHQPRKANQGRSSTGGHSEQQSHHATSTLRPSVAYQPAEFAQPRRAHPNQELTQRSRARMTTVAATDSRHSSKRSDRRSDSRVILPRESLQHAVNRMLDQGFSRHQVAGQIRRWHPTWSTGRIARELNRSAATRGHRGRGSGGIFGALEDLAQRVEHDASTVKRAFRYGEHVALDLVAVPPYAEYYASYNAAKWLNNLGRKGGFVGSVISHGVALPLTLREAEGLLLDVAIDRLKGESVRDERLRGLIDPLHSFPGIDKRLVPKSIRKIEIELPGAGKRHIDFEW